jgi:cation diffusion facilitator CzcD-associated flavoprotein CzcO
VQSADRRDAREVRVAIIGSGFAGLAMAIGLERRGIYELVARGAQIPGRGAAPGGRLMSP